jgi:predicted flap endonuclease-1-like 5' DNA nuclease
MMMFRKFGLLLTSLFVSLALSGFSSPAAGTEDSGNPWWIWILVLLALVLFAAVVLWWWLRSSGEEEEEVFQARPEPSVPLQVAGAEEQETLRAPAAPSTPPAADDLKRIEGIGPKISNLLQAAGITTFAQLAATEGERLRQILEAENPNLLRLADPSTWPEQARLAAAGDWEALEGLQDKLKGGRRA